MIKSLGLGLVIFLMSLTACGLSFQSFEYRRANTELENRNYPKALAAFQRLIKRYPGSSLAIEGSRRAARASLLEAKDYVAAVDFYRHLVLYSPDEKERIQSQKSLAGIYFEQLSNFEKAIEEYNKVTELSGKDIVTGKELSAKSLAAIGECYLKMGDFEKAQIYFKQSVDAYAENEILAYNVGEIYFSNQKIDEAIQYYELAVKIKPNWGTPYLRLGYAYLNKGTYDKAVQKFEKYLEIEPESSEAPKVKSLLEQLKKMNESLS